MAYSKKTPSSFQTEWHLLSRMGWEKGSPEDKAMHLDCHGRSLLMVCVFHHDLFDLKFLTYLADLSKPILNHVDGHGQNALTWALLYTKNAQQSRLPLIQMLLEKGVDPNQVNRLGFSQAMVALYHYPEALSLLVQHGADLDYYSPVLDKTIWQLSLEKDGLLARPYLEKALLEKMPLANQKSTILPRL